VLGWAFMYSKEDSRVESGVSSLELE
jgi:hypothetical protein